MGILFFVKSNRMEVISLTIQEALNAFFAQLAYDGHSDHTIKAYRQDLTQWYDYIAVQTFEQLGFRQFEAYFMFLFDKQLKTTTLRRKRVVLHRFLKYCYDKRFCSEKLHELIDPVKLKKHKKPKEVLTSQEITQLFDYIEMMQVTYYEKLGESNHYDYLYYTWVRNELLTYMLLYTGCRAAEAVSIRKQAVDFNQNTVTILAKGNKYNSVPLHETLLEAFESYTNKMASFPNQELLSHLAKSAYLFPARLDAKKSLSVRTLHDLMLKYSEVLERHIHAHLFRHTFASYCIAANMDISTISSLISHSNPAITLSIYTHEIESNQKHREMKKLTFQS